MNTNMHGGTTVAGNTESGGGRRGRLWKRPAWITALILLIPFLGNHFVDGWNWPLGAFILAGTLLFGTGLAFELVARKADTIWYRAAVGVALATAFVLVWINLAVEVIGDDNPANLMYFGVPIVGLIGAAIARFRPHGMARALFATGLAQALVPVIALILWNPRVTSWAPGVLPVFGLNAVFVLLFVGSALLFKKAARGNPHRARYNQ
jgi:hypothetical protein